MDLHENIENCSEALVSAFWGIIFDYVLNARYGRMSVVERTISKKYRSVIMTIIMLPTDH